MHPLKPILRLTPRALLVAAALVALPQGHGLIAQEQPAGSKDKAKKSAKAAAEVAAPKDALSTMGSMIPEGMKNLKVRIPAFEDGRASSLITAEALTRQDSNNLFAEDMVIKLFGAQTHEDIRVDLKTATFKMKEQVLSSQERSRVSRSDFRLEGDTMTFDTTTSQGKMVGRVEMIIYDTNSFSQKPTDPAATTTKPDSTGATTTTTSSSAQAQATPTQPKP